MEIGNLGKWKYIIIFCIIIYMAKTSKRQSKSRGKTMRRKRGGQKGGLDALHIMMLTATIIISIITILNTDRTATMQKFVKSENSNDMVFQLTDLEYNKLPLDFKSYFEKNTNSNVWISKFETNCETVERITQIFNQFAANIQCSNE